MSKTSAAQLTREIEDALANAPTTAPDALMRLHGTIEYLPGGREAVIVVTDGRGGWFGAERISLPRSKHGSAALYEQGYAAASIKAGAHGGMLDTFKAIK